MRRKIIEICLISFCLIFAAGCGGSDSSSGSADTDETEDTSGSEAGTPLEIASLTATAGNETVSLFWTESGTAGGVEITWSPNGTTAQSVEAGTGTFTATDLFLGTEYTFTVTSIDGDENVTAELTVAATPYKEGLPENAIFISSVSGLKAIDDAPSGYYVLTTDLDISGENWSPLGASSATIFKGTLDGNGHVITGLTISSSSGDQAFSAWIDDEGTVKNLGLENVSITASSDRSCALASMNDGTIDNCYSTGTVTGGYYTAGLVAYNYGGTISNSYSECKVVGSNYTGGLVGRSCDGGTITDCYATGSVSGTEAVGGVVGYLVNGGTISGCYATGNVTGTDDMTGGLVGQTGDHNTADDYVNTISDSWATGDVSGLSRVGGLVGQNEYCDITDCYADGNLNASGNIAGGLVGENNNSAITGCQASGTVAGASYTGGLIGLNDDSSATDAYDSTVSDSFTTAPSVSGNGYVGGLVGGNENGIIDFCYARISGDVEGSIYVGGLVGNHTNTLSADIGGIITYSFAEIGGCVNASDEKAGGLVGEINGLSVACCYAAAAGISADGSDGDGYYAGGLVGYCANASIGSEISNCYALSNVSGNSYIGGLVGGQYITTVNYCYATGVVSASGDNGGLIGYNYSGGINYSYFNSANTGNSYGTSVDLSYMADQGTFSGWDFAGETANGEEDIWSMDDSTTDPINSGYPYLTDLPPDE